jgi:hypothetical protein
MGLWLDIHSGCDMLSREKNIRDTKSVAAMIAHHTVRQLAVNHGQQL